MCDCKVYRPGDIIEVKGGGVLLRGGLAELSQDAKIARQNLEAAEQEVKVGKQGNVSKALQRDK